MISLWKKPQCPLMFFGVLHLVPQNTWKIWSFMCFALPHFREVWSLANQPLSCVSDSSQEALNTGIKSFLEIFRCFINHLWFYSCVLNENLSLCIWLKHMLLMCFWKEVKPQTNIQASASNEASTSCYFPAHGSNVRCAFSRPFTMAPTVNFWWASCGCCGKGSLKTWQPLGKKANQPLFPYFFIFIFWGALKGNLREKRWVGSFSITLR